MSGGSIGDYCYYRIGDFIYDLEAKIENNDVKDDFGSSPSLPDNILEVMRQEIPKMQRMIKVMQAIDYLYAGDHGEDSFLRAISRVESDHPNSLTEVFRDRDDLRAEVARLRALLQSKEELFTAEDMKELTDEMIRLRKSHGLTAFKRGAEAMRVCAIDVLDQEIKVSDGGGNATALCNDLKGRIQSIPVFETNHESE